MELERLKIENFRGIKGSYKFEPDGRNSIIVGPNGSGKTSVLEAINYVLTGQIRQLRRSGTGRVTDSDLIPNLSSDGECVVTGTFSAPDGDTKQELKRSISEGLEPPKEDFPASLKQTIDIAKQGQHILTREDLLDLIIAQPNERRDVLAELLNLPDIDERRKVLKRTRQNIDKKVDDAKASRDTAATQLAERTDSPTPDRSNLKDATLDTINELRESFDVEPIEEVDPDTVRDDIKSPVDAVSTEALQRERPREELDDFAEWLEYLQTEGIDGLQELKSKLREVRERESAEVNTKKLELLEIGEDVVSEDADYCPLCRQEWRGDVPLIEDVQRRRADLSELQELLDDIEQNQENLRRGLKRGLGHLDYLEKELDEDTYPKTRGLVEFSQDLSESIDVLSGDLVADDQSLAQSIPIVGEHEGKISLTIDNVLESTKSLQSSANKLDDLSESEKRYEQIRSISEQWDEYQNLEQKVRRLKSLRDQAEIAESAFNAARKEVIGSIYDDITDRVERYYERIHPDESDTRASLEVTDTGAELNKEFYEAGEYPPQSVFSEGHLDTLGLCLHLGLADYLQQEEKSFLLLDDVVMSVDQNHRLEIAKLIADEFADEYQVIITTHDELWAEQLASQGALRGGKRVNFREWSFDAGVVESRGYIDVYDQWETVEEAVENDEMQRAAHELRYATERMLQQTAVSLGAKVNYDPRLRHTLGDFKDAVSRRLNTLTGKAKANLDPSDDMFEQADELDNKYGPLLHDVGQKLNKVNRRVHWTPGKWLTLSPNEFEEVFEVHKEAYDLLYCDECGSSIRYEEFDDDYYELRCNCREHYDIQWN